MSIITRFFIRALALFSIWCLSSTAHAQAPLPVKDLLTYCEAQARATLQESHAAHRMPVYIDSGNTQWTDADIVNWRSGFWPGILWLLYEATGNTYWKAEAASWSAKLNPILDRPVYNHDLGFQFFCSYGPAYRLTHDAAYRQLMLRAADSLITLYNPKVGTMVSWPYRMRENKWPHNTIIDNMMNLELLFWAAREGNNKQLYDIAVHHAETTMKNHFRPDFSTYHVIWYDTATGRKIKGFTHQGYADTSMWARGQAWAIYGFTVAYRETGRKDFLQTAMKAAETYLKRLPADQIPYWDFDDPAIPNTPRDVSAAAVTASALLELSALCTDKALKKQYHQAALNMLREMSTDKYMSKDQNHAFLLHSTGNKPQGKEIDVPIIYADYYYLEALLRVQKMQPGMEKN